MKTRIDKGNFDLNFNLIFAWHVFDSMAETGTETPRMIYYTQAINKYEAMMMLPDEYKQSMLVY